MPARFASAVVVALLGAPAIAAADEVRYVTVDAVSAESAHLYEWGVVPVFVITGTPAGGVTETRSYFPRSGEPVDASIVDRCYRAAVVAVNKPGKLRLDLTFAMRHGDALVSKCNLVRID